VTYRYRTSTPSGPWKAAMLSLGSPQSLTQDELLSVASTHRLGRVGRKVVTSWLLAQRCFNPDKRESFYAWCCKVMWLLRCDGSSMMPQIKMVLPFYFESV